MAAGQERASSPQVERRPVEFTAAPASRLWIAVCLGVGGAILVACLMLGFGEVVLLVKRQLLEAIAQQT